MALFPELKSLNLKEYWKRRVETPSTTFKTGTTATFNFPPRPFPLFYPLLSQITFSFLPKWQLLSLNFKIQVKILPPPSRHKILILK